VTPPPAQKEPARFATPGHLAFAVMMIALGVISLIKGDFAPIWSPISSTLPLRGILVAVCAVLPLAAGFGLLWRRAAAAAALTLLIYHLGWLVAFNGRLLVHAPRELNSWWGFSQTLALVTSCWLLYTRFAPLSPGRAPTPARAARPPRIAQALYGFALLVFGIAHFLYLHLTALLVPAWLPAHTFWAAFTGATFLAAGAALLLGRCARLAATLTAWQIALFTLLVWLPTLFTGPNPFQWSEFVDSVTLTAVAWAIAEVLGSVDA
jgi:uncharacterized membrane protein